MPPGRRPLRRARPRHRALGRRTAQSGRRAHRPLPPQPRARHRHSELRVTVEPGVTNLEITRRVAPFGCYYAPDPSWQIVCSIGGTLPKTGRRALPEPRLHRSSCARCEADPQRRPCAARGSVLTPGLDLVAAIVGSEGTLAIVTKAIVHPAAARSRHDAPGPVLHRSTQPGKRCRRSSRRARSRGREMMDRSLSRPPKRRCIRGSPTPTPCSPSS